MTFKLSHKTTDQKELKPETGDKTKEEYLVALYVFVSVGLKESSSSRKELTDVTAEASLENVGVQESRPRQTT